MVSTAIDGTDVADSLAEVHMFTNIGSIDATLADSFPASDPPAWMSGTSLVRPVRRPVTSSAAGSDWLTRAGGHAQSTLAAIGVALLLPVFIVVLPIALAFRGVLAATHWRAIDGTENVGPGTTNLQAQIRA